MKIKPIAFDSFGARSMCTSIETRELKIIIDPSVALGPKRYGLPPHEIEIRRKEELWLDIKKEVLDSDVVIITHYHYDHHNPREPEILQKKVLLLKHPENAINKSQMTRSKFFLGLLNQLKYKPKIDFADSKEFEFGNLRISFSEPVPHGCDTRLGYVLEVLIEEKDRFLFTSDVEGITDDSQLQFVLKSDPDVIFMDGPMTYMPHIFNKKLLNKSIENILKVFEKTGVKTIVLDHHLTRDLKWRDKIRKLFDKAEEFNIELKSASEFFGIKEQLLEARRKELYSKSKL